MLVFATGSPSLPQSPVSVCLDTQGGRAALPYACLSEGSVHVPVSCLDGVDSDGLDSRVDGLEAAYVDAMEAAGVGLAVVEETE
ncbi:hypothetical protein KIPB_012090 [Kipferlia bialata]|uniref:Uncharacterized protein n=1 Tax=Kipferlia bialata TaxID=797122 RepID=A0A391NR30_9EUKA|nr:hypothetical protein KIPB_012090 [Kipferlia bialata]|eukprot:g12090.t1